MVATRLSLKSFRRVPIVFSLCAFGLLQKKRENDILYVQVNHSVSIEIIAEN